MSVIRDRAAAIGAVFPAPKVPVANYLGTKRSGSLLFVSIEKMLGFVRSASDFTQQPQVIDGASDLLIELWGEAGRHARTATGVAQLPFGAAVQLELIVRLADEPGDST